MVDLPLPGGPTMPMVSPRARLEADVAQRRPAGAGIGEADVLEAQRAVGDARAAGRPGRSAISTLEVEEAEEPRAAGRGAGEGVDQQAELAHRHLQDGHEGQERRSACRRSSRPRSTLWPPTQSTRPIAAKKEKRHRAGVADADVDALVREVERVACEAASNLASSCAWPAKARTTRMPPRFSSITRVSDRQPLLQLEPGGAQRQVRDRGAPGDEGHEAQRQEPEHQVGGDQEIGADADQHGQQHEAHDAGGKEHAHALEVEHAEVMRSPECTRSWKPKAQALDLLVEGEAQLVADVVADRLADSSSAPW